MTQSQSTSPMETSPTAMDDEPEIVLICANESYWVAEGEAHLDIMLQGNTGYPTPVGVLHFSSVKALEANLGSTLKDANLWAVHPAIIERLRDDHHLLEIVVAPD